MEITGIRCTKCGDEIFSKSRHDFKWCGCKTVAIDGGRDYTKITGNFGDYEYISIDLKNLKDDLEE